MADNAVVADERGRPEPAQVPHPGHDRHRGGRRGVRRRAVHRVLEPLRARPRPGRAGGDRYLQARSRADGHDRVAQVADLRRAAHPRHGGAHLRPRRRPEGPDLPGLRLSPPYAKNTERSRSAELLVLIGTCTHLGCLPKQRFDAGEIYPELAGRLFLPLPRLALRSCRTGLQRLAGLDQPASCRRTRTRTRTRCWSVPMRKGAA